MLNMRLKLSKKSVSVGIHYDDCSITIYMVVLVKETIA